MAEEREGTAEDFVDLFGRPQQQADQETEQEQAEKPATDQPESKPAEPEQTEPTDDARAQAAQLLGLSPELAHRLRGDTVQEITADAAELAATLEGLRRQRQPRPRVNFDGGVREPGPRSVNGAAEHGPWLADLIHGYTPEEIERRRGQGA
jgi:hypothetical protein